MMISPEAYLDSVKDETYEELLEERESLIEEIHEFEKTKDMPRDIIESPSPEVRYQMNHEYLAKLCEYISERYNEEFVWGNK